MPNVLVTGSNGQLGSELQEEASNASLQDSQFFFTDKDEVDISRGDMLVHTNSLPAVSNNIKVMLVWMDEVLATYRIMSNSISSNKLKLLKYNYLLFRKYEKFSIIKSVYYLTWNIAIKLINKR